MYKFSKLSQSEFDAIAQANPETFIPLEQTPQWSAFDELAGNRDIQGVFAYYTKHDKLVATARINIFKQALRTSIVITQGPIWYKKPTEREEIELVETLKEQFKNSGALYLRLQLHHEIPAAVRPFELVTFDRMMWVDISPDEKALLKTFKPDVRQSIRKAKRLGVEVSEIPVTEREELLENELMGLMEETEGRNAFRAHPADVYKNLMKAFPQEVKLFVAYCEGRAISWLISTEYRGHAVYLYAAGGEEARKKFAAYALQWHCILDMKSRGNTVWNMTGIESPHYPNLENVTVFKRKFSQWEVQLPLVYDVPLKPLQYKAIAKGLTARRKLV